jgi:hypothetical protein
MKTKKAEIRIVNPSDKLIKEIEKFGQGVDSIPVAAHKALLKYFKIK